MMKPFYWLATASASFSLLMTIPCVAISAETNNRRIPAQSSVERRKAPKLNLVPVEFTIAGQTITSNVLVRGQENSWEAVDFENWLLPLETVIEALAFQVNTLDNGHWELELPDRVTRINPNKIKVDPKLGLVLSVQEMEKLLGVPINFNRNSHSINFTPSWLAIGAPLTLNNSQDYVNYSDFNSIISLANPDHFYNYSNNFPQVNYSMNLGDESLTLNMEMIYNDFFKGLSEILYQPQDIPLEIKISTLTNSNYNRIDFHTNLNFKPLPNLSFNYSGNRHSQRFNINWQAIPGFTLRFSGNHRNDAFGGGVAFAYNNNDFVAFGNANVDGKNNLLWNITTKIGPLQFSYQDRINYNNYKLILDLDKEINFHSGHQLVFNYENRHRHKYEYLNTFFWQYRSQATSEKKAWEFNLGYTIGSYGDGLVLSLARELFLGLILRINYQQVGMYSDSPVFQFKLETP